MILESAKEFGFNGCLFQTQEMLTHVCARFLSLTATCSFQIPTQSPSFRPQPFSTIPVSKHAHTHTMRTGSPPRPTRPPPRLSKLLSALDTWHPYHGDSPGFLPVSTPARLPTQSHSDTLHLSETTILSPLMLRETACPALTTSAPRPAQGPCGAPLLATRPTITHRPRLSICPPLLNLVARHHCANPGLGLAAPPPSRGGL